MDRTIHLPKTDKHAEAYVELEKVWITQSDLDGLHDLLAWAEGFQDGRDVRGALPGFIDTVMFYRKLGTVVNEQKRKDKERNDEEKPVG